jgi:hypothetical protein
LRMELSSESEAVVADAGMYPFSSATPVMHDQLTEPMATRRRETSSFLGIPWHSTLTVYMAFHLCTEYIR